MNEITVVETQERVGTAVLFTRRVNGRVVFVDLLPKTTVCVLAPIASGREKP